MAEARTQNIVCKRIDFYNGGVIIELHGWTVHVLCECGAVRLNL